MPSDGQASGKTKRKPLIIGGERIPLGATREINLKFSENYLGMPVSLPLRVIRARKHGPCVFLTGSIHGDELNGMGIIRDLLYDQPPPLIRGTLICIPVVNLYGLEHNRRYMPDRRDLNRCFPGFESGSPTSRLAYALFHEVVKQCDYGIDFHSAALRRTNYPNVRASLSNPRVKALAQAFGAELLLDSKGPNGSLRRTAVRHGVPTIVVEAGEVWKIEPGVVDYGVRGCFNIFKWLGMLSGEQEKPLFQVNLKKTTWVRADRGGILGFHVRPGELVEEGAVIATNHNIFGKERRTMQAPVRGIVLGMTTMPAVKPGEPVYHLAELSKRNFRNIAHAMERIPQEQLYHRIQNDLATNITIQGR